MSEVSAMASFLSDLLGGNEQEARCIGFWGVLGRDPHLEVTERGRDACSADERFGVVLEGGLTLWILAAADEP